MLFNRSRRLAFSLGAFALLLPLTGGCGAGKGDVSGTVNLDGKPLPAGTITFYPAKKSLGNPISGGITDGKYSVTGVPLGKLKVTVETSAMKKEADTLLQQSSSSGMAKSMKGRTKEMPPAAKQAMEKEKTAVEEAKQKAKDLMEKYRPIPEKYESKDTTPLSTDVNKGSNTYDVPLTSK